MVQNDQTISWKHLIYRLMQTLECTYITIARLQNVYVYIFYYYYNVAEHFAVLQLNMLVAQMEVM